MGGGEASWRGVEAVSSVELPARGGGGATTTREGAQWEDAAPVAPTKGRKRRPTAHSAPARGRPGPRKKVCQPKTKSRFFGTHGFPRRARPAAALGQAVAQQPCRRATLASTLATATPPTTPVPRGRKAKQTPSQRLDAHRTCAEAGAACGAAHRGGVHVAGARRACRHVGCATTYVAPAGPATRRRPAGPGRQEMISPSTLLRSTKKVACPHFSSGGRPAPLAAAAATVPACRASRLKHRHTGYRQAHCPHPLPCSARPSALPGRWSKR